MREQSKRVKQLKLTKQSKRNIILTLLYFNCEAIVKGVRDVTTNKKSAARCISSNGGRSANAGWARRGGIAPRHEVVGSKTNNLQNDHRIANTRFANNIISTSPWGDILSTSNVGSKLRRHHKTSNLFWLRHIINEWRLFVTTHQSVDEVNFLCGIKLCVYKLCNYWIMQTSNYTIF
jgi:hypothetical protein